MRVTNNNEGRNRMHKFRMGLIVITKTRMNKLKYKATASLYIDVNHEESIRVYSYGRTKLEAQMMLTDAAIYEINKLNEKAA